MHHHPDTRLFIVVDAAPDEGLHRSLMSTVKPLFGDGCRLVALSMEYYEIRCLIISKE